MDQIEIIRKKTVSSTNDEVKQLNRDLVLVTAEEQTKGRGQRGNSWESEKGKNLTFSLLVKPKNLYIEKQFYLSKTVSLAVVNTLKRYGLETTVKWPNDIYTGRKKITGILIENDVYAGGRINRSTIGIGININQRQFISDAPNPTSLINETGKETSPEEVLHLFCEEFRKLYETLNNEEYDLLDTLYWKHLYQKDEYHPYKDASGTFLGKITGVLPEGELVIETENGEKRQYLFKEVSFIL